MAYSYLVPLGFGQVVDELLVLLEPLPVDLDHHLRIQGGVVYLVFTQGPSLPVRQCLLLAQLFA